MSTHVYYPEMEEKNPAPDAIQASHSHSGRHYYLRCKNKLKPARGIVFQSTYKDSDLVPGSRFVGWHCYKVTEKAFKQIEKENAVVFEALL